jgi:mannose-6-phosphate isomerase-like protein (cupin superfamily)
MPGWVGNIEQETLSNETFRTVVFTGEHTQLTVMSIESGTARVELGGSEGSPEEVHEVADDWAIIVPSGSWHNVVNTGSGKLKVYSLYSPPEHPDGTVHRTKADALAAEH